MDRTEFILSAQESGWLVHASVPEGVGLVCRCPSCSEAVFVPEAVVEKGELPDPCEAHHRPWVAGYEIKSYEELVAHLTAARGRFGVNQETLNSAIGLTDGHMNKLEAFWRGASVATLMPWLAALGLRLVLQPVAMPRRVVSLVKPRGQSLTSRRAQARVALMAFAKLAPRRLGDDEEGEDEAA